MPSALNQQLDDPAFPLVTYRCGARGQPVAVVRRTGIRVQTVVVAARTWDISPEQIATEYDVSIVYVRQALSFYDGHRCEIDAAIEAEDALEAEAHG